MNIEIGKNEYVAVMGTSGSGKSTLMNILGCLDRPTIGTYELDGKLTTRLGAAALANVRNERIGFVFQSLRAAAAICTALKNVELPLIYSARRLAHPPGGGEESPDDTVGLRRPHAPPAQSTFRRAKAARCHRPALVARPAILLADEPTGNLDSRNERGNPRPVRRTAQRGQTIIMVTHEADVARHAKRIIRMKDGRVHSDLPVEQDAVSQVHEDDAGCRRRCWHELHPSSRSRRSSSPTRVFSWRWDRSGRTRCGRS